MYLNHAELGPQAKVCHMDLQLHIHWHTRSEPGTAKSSKEDTQLRKTKSISVSKGGCAPSNPAQALRRTIQDSESKL